MECKVMDNDCVLMPSERFIGKVFPNGWRKLHMRISVRNS